MSDKKRLLVVTSTFPRWPGDHEPPFVFELAKRLTDDFEVMVLAPHAPGAARRERMDGVSVYRFRYCFSSLEVLAYNGGIMANLRKHWIRYLLVPLFMLSQFFNLLYLIRKYRIDLIHAHWLIPQGVVAACVQRLCYRTRPTFVCTSHGSDLFGLPGRFFTGMKKWVAMHADQLTVVSEAMRIEASQLGCLRPVQVIPMGVDMTGRFTPPAVGDRNQNEILFVGRLVQGKGLHYLIQAMVDVVHRYPDANLTVAGDGPDRNAFEGMASDLGLNTKIRFLGALENNALPSLYGQATIFVLPSLGEGLGLTLIEAMGCECPVVASDLPSVRDLIVDGVTGLICKVADAGDIAEKIIDLLDHPDKRSVLAHAGRVHVAKRYGWEIVADRYRDLFEVFTRIA